MVITNKEYFAKGKRGLVYLATWNKKKVLVKEKNPEATIDTVKHEADMLVRLNRVDIGPQFYALEEGSLIREYIDGEEFLDYLKKASKKETIRVLIEIFRQCRKMDLLGINKFELTRPFKHILITKKGRVVQIDFERCKLTQKPKNVTQFAQCIMRGNVQEILGEKDIEINNHKLLELTKEYKHKLNIDIFVQILQLFGKTKETSTFAEKVYEQCTRIPKGKVVTYKDIAHALNTRAYRAVGSALKKNPYAPNVPCHRVIASNGTIGGFMGVTTGDPIKRKIELLKQEGVHDINKHRYTFPKGS